MTTTTVFNTQVISKPIREQLESLHHLVWHTLQGNSSWHRGGENPYDFYLNWSCYNQEFYLSKIKGELRDLPYVIDFVCLSKSFVELILPSRKYVFADNPNYGHFRTPNSIYLQSGSSYYADRWQDEPVEEFITKPFANFQGRCRKHWLMSPDKEQEAVDFLADLIQVIKERRG